MLPLDDPRWPDLDHRGWSAGVGEPDAPVVADELRYLRAHPTDRERFNDLWPYLCSEGTAWPAAYAAVPHLVDIARHLPPADRDDYLYVVGLIVICSGDYGHTPAGLADDIVAAYGHALPEALILLTETLISPHDQTTTRYLLAATAALKGHPALAEVLDDLDIYAECQSCGEPMIEMPA